MNCRCEKCDNYYTCQYMQHRFETFECIKDKKKIEIIHQREIKKREEILRGINNVRRYKK